jgi:hypothetical protein
MLAHLTQRVINLLISLGVVLVHFFNNKTFSSKTTQPNQSYLEVLKGLGGGRVMVFNATFNNISGISWQSVL